MSTFLCGRVRCSLFSRLQITVFDVFRVAAVPNLWIIFASLKYCILMSRFVSLARFKQFVCSFLHLELIRSRIIYVIQTETGKCVSRPAHIFIITAATDALSISASLRSY